MGFSPADWSVVIAGRWNRAILTPSGVRKWLFGFEEATQVRVAVPLDGVSPYMVGHPTQQIAVMTEESRLLIRAERPDYETLQYAMSAGIKAMTSLPATPVSAAGFNVNFHSEDATPQMAALLTAESEKALIVAGYRPVGRTIGRSLE